MRPAIILAIILFLAPGVGAQESANPITACFDRVRVLSVLVDGYASSRQKQEIDSAQAIAELSKQLEALRAELAKLKAPPAPATPTK
jgi:hypothetical protein